MRYWRVMRCHYCLVFAIAVMGCTSGDGQPLAADASVGLPDAMDSPDSAPIRVDAAPAPTADYVFDDGALRSYELSVSQADLAWLNSNILLEQYVPATLTFEGREIGPVGLRYKGSYGTLNSCVDSSGAKTCSKLSMKIKFNKYNPALRFYGLKKLNFHAMNSDRSQLRDRLAYSLFRASGVVASRAVHAKLSINGVDQGLFALVEQVDGRFTKARFADGGNGNLYKEVWPLHTRPDPYLSALKTNVTQNPDVTPMIRFAQALATATDGSIETLLDSWMDLDGMMAYLAVDRAIENWDGAVGFWCVNGACGNHNYYWYQGQIEDFVTLIPWDMDNTFQTPNPLVRRGQPLWDADPVDCTPVDVFTIPGLGPVGRRGASCDPLIRWLGVTLRSRYLSAAQAFLDGPFSVSRVDGLLDTWQAQIAQEVASDTFGPGTVVWQAEVASLRASISTLRARLVSQLAQ